MIAIVDYGLGNLRAFANIYKRLGIPLEVATTPEQLRAADRIILPGVGAFDWAMRRLDECGMRSELDRLAERGATPILGVCVGMQMMARRSDEGQLAGLGWIDGEVKRFDRHKVRLPHMGWNDVIPSRDDSLLSRLESGSRFYFLHSYYFVPTEENAVLAVADYGSAFTAAVRKGNLYGVQFHPEKSHQWGIQLLKNFAELTPC